MNSSVTQLTNTCSSFINIQLSLFINFHHAHYGLEAFKTFIIHLNCFAKNSVWLAMYFVGRQLKLDGVGPVDNIPSTDKLHHFVKKKNCDMWHVTCDTWHATCDMWRAVGGLGRKGSQTESMNQWINDKADCITAPSTPGLLNIYNK